VDYGKPDLESRSDYLLRKNAEIALLNGMLDQPLSSPPATSIDELLRGKLALRARQMCELLQRHPDLAETCFDAQPERRFGNYALSYLYQRFELIVDGAPIHSQPDLSLIRHERYFSSGMGALSAVLLALNELWPKASLHMLQDSYFETLELLRRPGVHFDLRCEATPRALLGALRRGRQSGAPRIALLDSICAEDPTAILAEAQPGVLDLLLADSTCYEANSPRILSLVRGAWRLKVPVVLLRSHQKLDYLGVEYGRLGSAVFLTSPLVPRAGQVLVRNLRRRSARLSRLLGNTALPMHLPPCAGDPSFTACNHERLALMERCNLAGGRRMQRALAPAAIPVRIHHHGRFFTVEPFPRSLGRAACERKLRQLADQASDQGLALRAAASFGFDFAALSICRLPPDERLALRVALPDFCQEDWLAVCDFLIAACRKMARGGR